MSEEEVTTTGGNPYLIPGAIIIAGAIIAGAVMWNANSAPTAVAPTGKTLEPQVLPVTEDDHILGSSDADVFLIEYSDYQCPFCTRFHATVKEVLANNDGRVSWVYRHFPLDSIHPEARPAAEASECAAEQGGDDAFWGFTDKVFENENVVLSRDTYIAWAGELGLDQSDFTECIDSGRMADRVERDYQNGVEIGAQGTPFTVLLTRKGDNLTFSGALPIDRVQPLVDRALSSLEE
jgi:protein-disulfide isomerase